MRSVLTAFALPLNQCQWLLSLVWLNLLMNLFGIKGCNPVIFETVDKDQG